MKTLIIYYSRTGNTRKLGQMIANKLNADIDEIKDMKKRNGFISLVMGSFAAIFKKDTIITYNHGHEPKDYDMIVIGSPNWAGHLAPSVRTFMKNHKDVLMNKKLAFFCTCGGNKGKIFEDMKNITKQPIEVLAVKQKEIDNSKKKIEEFVEKIR